MVSHRGTHELNNQSRRVFLARRTDVHAPVLPAAVFLLFRERSKIIYV
jgi:hypothetical protein